MLTCPRCDKELPGQFPYCPYCGAALDDPAVGAAEERKVVSVLFCDLVGFTSASESTDPEDVRRWLVPYQDLLRETMQAFGGTVEKFAGDAIMAVFGAPTAHEDDAERAVRAGLRVLERLADAEVADVLHVRIGISTGEAVVALSARPEAGESFVTGDVVNTAARLQTAAPVDAVIVTDRTYQTTKNVFDYEPLEPVHAKGKAEPVVAWRAGAPHARMGADVIRSLTTPLVGRTRDLTLLLTAFEKAMAERSVQLLTLIGEPGIGKSRLVAELLADIDRRPGLVTWRQARCLPYGEGPFWALSEIVKAHAGIYDDDDADKATAKLDAVLPDREDRTWLRARLLPLLGIGSGVAASRDESFTAWRLFIEALAESGPTVIVLEDLHWADDALLDFIEHLTQWSSELPLLVVATTRPELLEQHPNWTGGMRNALSIGLSRLSDAETDQLLSTMLTDLVVEPSTRAAVLERAEGNPLYAEEFARMLRDRAAGAARLADSHEPGAPIEPPVGIAALVAARLDALPQEHKALLADAAVVGKVFWAEAVASMGGRDPVDVERALHDLGRKELVRVVRQPSMAGQREYVFWHVLVRDVAYSQLPRVGRAQRHVAAADWIEGQVEHRIADTADILTHHLGTALDLLHATGDVRGVAELTPRVRRYALLAAETAMNLDAAQTTTLLDRALALTPEADPQHASVLLTWARAALQAGREDECVEACHAAQAAFEAHGDLEGQARTLALAGLALTDMDAAVAASARAVAMVRPLGPSPVLVEALASQAVVANVASRPTTAVSAADEALETARDGGLPPPYRALGARALARVASGDTAGLDDSRLALRSLLDAGAGREAAVVWLNYTIGLREVEGPVAALAELAEAHAFSLHRGIVQLDRALRSCALQSRIEIGELAAVVEDWRTGPLSNLPTAQYTIEVLAGAGRALAELDVAAAAEPAEDALTQALQHGWPDTILLAGTAAVLSRAAVGDREGARRVLTTVTELDGLPESPEIGTRLPALVRAAVSVEEPALGAAIAARVDPRLPVRAHAQVTVRAILLEAAGDHETACAEYSDAAARWAGFGNRLEQAYALLGLGRSRLSCDDPAGRQALVEARAQFAAMGATIRLAECDDLLGTVGG